MSYIYCRTDLLLLLMNVDIDPYSMLSYNKCQRMSLMKPVSTRMPSYNHPYNTPPFDTYNTDICLSPAPTPGL